MNISYRTRQNLRRSLSIVITVLVLTVVFILCMLLWLQRFIVYTDEGVILDFHRSNSGEAQLPQQDKIPPTASIQYSDAPFQEGLRQLSGYYVSSKDLMKDPLAVQSRLAQLPSGTPVMLDVKGYRGYFYYSTQVGENTSSSYNIAKMDELIRWLAQSDLYVIARISALRDFDLVWNDKSQSVALKTNSGVAYSDEGEYGIGYWLDPANATVQNYLIDTVNELQAKGFDEVILQNFCFPDSDNIAFKQDRAQILEQLAQKLFTSCANAGFVLSFSSEDPTFQLPEGRCRLYLENVDAEQAQIAWSQATLEDKRRYLVFIAPSGDTRYDIENGILRPLT